MIFMPNKKNIEWKSLMGKRLIVLGIVLLLIGILRFYNFDWPSILMIVGIFLIVKGIIIKYVEK